MVAVGAIGLTVLVIIITIFVTNMKSNADRMEENTQGIKCSEGSGTEAGVTYTYSVMSPSQCKAEGGKIAIGAYTDDEGKRLDGITRVCCITTS